MDSLSCSLTYFLYFLFHAFVALDFVPSVVIVIAREQQMRRWLISNCKLRIILGRILLALTGSITSITFICYFFQSVMAIMLLF